MNETPLKAPFGSRLKAVFITYFKDLKAVGGDTAETYRHFLHWNLSKIVIFAYAFGMGLLFSLPFIAAIIGIGYFAYSYPAGEFTKTFLQGGVASAQGFQAVIFENFWGIVTALLLLVVVVGIFSFFVTYGYLLLSNVCRTYLEGSVLSLRKNEYFNRKLIVKFLYVLSWISGYLLGIFLIGCLLVALCFVVIIGSGGLDAAAESIPLAASTATVAFTTFLAMIYVAIRTGFSSLVLLSESGSTAFSSGRSYVRESLELTKGKFIRVIMLVLPFALLFGLAESIFQSVENSLSSNRAYQEAVRLKETEGKDMKEADFLARYVDRSLETDDQRKIIGALVGHESQTTGIDRDFFEEILPFLDAKKLDPHYQKYASAFNVAIFLFLDGLIYMAYLSIFVRIGGIARRTPEEASVTGDDEGVAVDSPTPTELEPSGKKPAVKKAAPAKKSSAPEKTSTPKKPSVKKSEGDEKTPAKKAPAKVKKPAAKTKKTAEK